MATTTPTTTAPAVAPKKAAAPAKRAYRMIAGKTFLKNDDGTETKYVEGDKVLLTAAEAAGRTGQITLWTELADEVTEATEE